MFQQTPSTPNTHLPEGIWSSCRKIRDDIRSSSLVFSPVFMHQKMHVCCLNTTFLEYISQKKSARNYPCLTVNQLFLKFFQKTPRSSTKSTNHRHPPSTPRLFVCFNSEDPQNFSPEYDRSITIRPPLAGRRMGFWGVWCGFWWLKETNPLKEYGYQDLRYDNCIYHIYMYINNYLYKGM